MNSLRGKTNSNTPINANLQRVLDEFKKIFEESPKRSKAFWHFFAMYLHNATDEKVAQLVKAIYKLMTQENIKNVRIVTLKNTISTNSPKTNANKNATFTTIKTELRRFVIERIRKMIDEGGGGEFKYEPRGTYRNKIKILYLYREIPDDLIQKEVDYHLVRFRAAGNKKVIRPPRAGYGYYRSGAGYGEAISSANRNIERYLASRRAPRRGESSSSRRENLEDMIKRLEREREGGNRERIRGAPEYNNYLRKRENRNEYNALKKLTQQPQIPMGEVPAAPFQPAPSKLYGVSPQSEERIKKNLSPTELSVVNKAGDLAAVNRILKAAGGVSKVRQAANVLRQVPKDEALRLHLISKKAAAAVNLFGGPNKADAAVKIDKKITSARRVKRSPQKKKKTPVKEKAMKKIVSPTSPLRTKVLKNALKQVSKSKLIEIAGKSTLGIYDKARTPKKMVINDFTKYIQRKPKPKPKTAKAKATVAKGKRRPSKSKRTKK